MRRSTDSVGYCSHLPSEFVSQHPVGHKRCLQCLDHGGPGVVTGAAILPGGEDEREDLSAGGRGVKVVVRCQLLVSDAQLDSNLEPFAGHACGHLVDEVQRVWCTEQATWTPRTEALFCDGVNVALIMAPSGTLKVTHTIGLHH